MKLRNELSIRQNVFCFNLPKTMKDDNPAIEKIRKLARKYVYKKDLVRDSLYKELTRQGLILGVMAKHNLVPTVGRAVIAERLAGGITYSGEVDWGAVGDGTTPFSNASTQLNNEIYRKQAASQVFDENIAYIDWFIAAGDTPDRSQQSLRNHG